MSAESVQPPSGALVGPLEVGPVAHGGHCVARHDGRVIFVRQAIPGETVMVRVSDDSKKNFWRGDAVEVIVPSPDRVTPPCPIAGVCGGCDFQHVGAARQRELKRQVVAEQLHRLAGIEWTGTVEQVDPRWGWRTRARYAVDHGEARARVGMRAHRSHEVVELPEQGCLIASDRGPSRSELDELAQRAGDEIRVVVPAKGAPLALVGDERHSEDLVLESSGGRDFRVRADGFWQVHPAAAELLVDVALAGLQPREGEFGLDLYCGVGLFAGAMADRGVRVTGVESVRSAIRLARQNVPEARFIASPLAKALKQLDRADIVVLDPPRNGAGEQVVRHVAGLTPRAIAYVACDPAALARDLATFADAGYRNSSIRAFDLFPMTHHVECVAILEPR